VTVSPIARRSRFLAAAAASLLAATLAGCGSDTAADASASEGKPKATDNASSTGEGVEVRLGYFPNLTHATALVGLEKGYYEDALAQDGATLEPLEFNSGSDTVDALLSGSLDATYIGPSPTLTAYSEDQGAVRVVTGAASGGASLVVSPDISSVQDLKGKTIGTPGAGNTQDIAARYYLKTKGLDTNIDGTGEVSILAQDNSINVQTFEQGEIDGAWVPEPYASILESKGGKVLVDEADLWPNGEFITTQLLVSTEFMDEHPDLVADLLEAHVQANEFINGSEDEAKKLIADKLFELTKSELPQDIFESAWNKVTFSNDPLASTLQEGAKHAAAVELLDPIDVADLYDLEPLNAILEANGEQKVSGL
jgi:NitT/TauT family transport system substrate-binding protein